MARKALSEELVSARAFPTGVIALASAVSLLALACTAQGRAGDAWTTCRLHEDLPGGGRLNYLGEAGPGPSFKQLLLWSSGEPGQPNLTLDWRDLAGAPVSGEISYRLGAEMGATPQPVTYKVVLDFNGAAAVASLPLGSRDGDRLTTRFDTSRNGDLMENFAHARRVTARVYKGDQQIGQGAFDLAPERWRTSFAAFARRVQANDPTVCHATSGPTVPVPPIEHRRLR